MYASRVSCRLSARRFSTSAQRLVLTPVALSNAERISANWKGTSATGGTTKNFIGGEWLESKASEWIDVLDPSTQTLLTRVPHTTANEFAQAVDAASEAFKTWQKTSVLGRQRIVLKFAFLFYFLRSSPSFDNVIVYSNTFAKTPTQLQVVLCWNKEKQWQVGTSHSDRFISSSHATDAHGDLLRGLQVVETSIAVTSSLMGEKLEVSKDMDTFVRKVPLGVCASIAPFNFPAYDA
ncbi:hypothetical protein H0H93_008679 [Arthromyces matolae]|nr:hypothetical protein H0H93_008679 [Arthromyces matolae]